VALRSGGGQVDFGGGADFDESNPELDPPTASAENDVKKSAGVLSRRRITGVSGARRLGRRGGGDLAYLNLGGFSVEKNGNKTSNNRKHQKKIIPANSVQKAT